MTTLITLGLSGLSILVPLLFIHLLRTTRNKSSDGKSHQKFNRLLAAGVILWTLLIWITGTQGWFAHSPGESFPKFLLALFLPVVFFTPLFFTQSFKRSLSAITLRQLVGFQFWRVFGVIFLLVSSIGLGPQQLAFSGYGDLLTGILAISAYILLKRDHKNAKASVWAFSAVGIADLLGILYVLLSNYPIWSNANPSSAFAGEYPMILLIGIVAPIALLFHIFTVIKLYNISKS